MRAFIAVALICGITAVTIIGLYQLKDSHIAISNVCNEFLYPDTCGSGSTQRKN